MGQYDCICGENAGLLLNDPVSFFNVFVVDYSYATMTGEGPGLNPTHVNYLPFDISSFAVRTVMAAPFRIV